MWLYRPSILLRTWRARDFIVPSLTVGFSASREMKVCVRSWQRERIFASLQAATHALFPSRTGGRVLLPTPKAGANFRLFPSCVVGTQMYQRPR